MDEEQGGSPKLFRIAALESQRRAALGSIQINTPPAFWAVSVLAVAFVVAAVTYLFLGHYTQRATVQGTLVPTSGLVTLNATNAGDVLAVNVRQGERVLAGQTLASFDNPLESAALGNTLAFITAELDTERKGLEQDLATQRALAASQSATLRQSVTSLRAQLRQIDAQLVLQRQEAVNMAGLLKSITPLRAQGIVSLYDLQQQQADTFNAELQVKALRRERLSLAQQLAQAEQQRAQVPLTLAAQQNATRNKLAQIEQALAQNEAQREWVVKAPRAGIVATLLIEPGETVSAGEPLLTVVPRHSRLEAQLLVPSSAVGFVRRGQRVVLRYQAFPYQRFGLHFGEVGQVSRSALSPQEVDALVGRQSTVPLYRVMVRLRGQTVRAYGQPVALRPGMALHADILLDRRRLIQWVLEPLYGFSRRMTASAPPGATAMPRAAASAGVGT
jgi:membrane fusion protein